jgi:glycogen debranching enzyme
MHYISNILLRHARHIENDPWRGLPELTNHSNFTKSESW